MKEDSEPEYADLTPVESVILTIHGERVILAADLARIYGVETRTLNQAVQRNREKFPEDFMFQLSWDDVAELPTGRSQAQRSKEHQHLRYTPYAFTEHGAIMAANILNSPRAVQMSVFVVRAFVKMRAALSDTRDLARKLAELEKELKSRLDVHESAIVDILQRVMNLFEPPPLAPAPTKREIGFHREKSETTRSSKYRKEMKIDRRK